MIFWVSVHISIFTLYINKLLNNYKHARQLWHSKLLHTSTVHQCEFLRVYFPQLWTHFCDTFNCKCSRVRSLFHHYSLWQALSWQMAWSQQHMWRSTQCTEQDLTIMTCTMTRHTADSSWHLLQTVSKLALISSHSAPPRCPCGEGVHLKSSRPGIPACTMDLLQVESYQWLKSRYSSSYPAWCYRISAGTGWPCVIL